MAENWDAEAWKAMERLSRAHKRGTGCRLTAEMVSTLAVTNFGQLWAVADEDIKPPSKEKNDAG